MTKMRRNRFKTSEPRKPPQTQIYDPYSRQFIGTEEEVQREFQSIEGWQLEWLLNFVQRTEVRPDDLKMIQPFIAMYMSIEWDPAKTEIAADELQKFAEKVHKEIRLCLIDRMPWRFPLHSTEGFIWPGNFSVPGESIVATTDWKTAFRLRAADLIARHRRTIRRCERTECGRLFVASGKQTFCTPRCSQMKRLHDFRAKSKNA